MLRTTWKAFIAFLGVLAFVIAGNNAVALVLWLVLKIAWWSLIAPSCLYTSNGLPAPPPQDYLINLIVFVPLSWLAWVYVRRNESHILKDTKRREEYGKVLDSSGESPQRPPTVPLAKALGVVILIVVCISLLEQAPLLLDKIDNSGWISHNKIVAVRLTPLSWIPGEFKTCRSLGPPGAIDFSSIPGHRALGPKREITSLECDASGDYHDLKVRFWGPATGLQTTTWNCQRTESGEGTSLSCKIKD